MIDSGKRVLSVGQCVPDNATLSAYLNQHFGAQIVGADLPGDALDKLRVGRFDLVLINRKLDADYSDGEEVLKLIKADPALAKTPVMVITNYPEHQESAVKLGAEWGFGKKEYGKAETLERLKKFLG